MKDKRFLPFGGQDLFKKDKENDPFENKQFKAFEGQDLFKEDKKFKAFDGQNLAKERDKFKAFEGQDLFKSGARAEREERNKFKPFHIERQEQNVREKWHLNRQRMTLTDNDEPTTLGAEKIRQLMLKLSRTMGGFLGKKQLNFSDGTTAFLKDLGDGKSRVEIKSPFQQKEEKRKIKKKRELTLETTPGKYVLLVELYPVGNTPRYDDDVTPAGFAVFEPQIGRGQAADSAPVENPTFTFAGVVIGGVVENDLVRTGKGDPTDHAGGRTWRRGWLSTKQATKQYEQQVRVDQGWYAYAGEAWDYQFNPVNANATLSNVWTWEDWGNLDCQKGWAEYSPGPPPEEFCGYSWQESSPRANLGLPFIEQTADYWDERHLFYFVVYGQGPEYIFNYWWPPEWNQTCDEHWFWNEEAFITTVDHEMDFWGDSYGAMEELGVTNCPAWSAGWGFENSFGKLTVEDIRTRRIWGILWGRGGGQMALEDFPPGEYPYHSTGPTTNSQVHTQVGSEFRYWGTQGVHVRTTAEERVRYFIQEQSHFGTHSPALSTTTAGWRIMQRHNNYDGDEHFRFPSELTERQLMIRQGNINYLSGWLGPAPFTGEYYLEHYENTFPTFPVNGFLVSGRNYHVCNGEVAADLSRIDWGDAFDYGIFSKDMKGINKETGAITTDDIEPIYAASFVKNDSYGFARSEARLCYCMILDNFMYRTDWYTIADNGVDITIPQLANVRDGNGNAITATCFVRVAKKSDVYSLTLESEWEQDA